MNETSSSPNDNSDLAARLRLERNRRAWTQETLADKAGVGLRTIQRIECGEAPSPETLRLIAAAFGIAPAEIGGAARRTLFKSPYLSRQRALMLALGLGMLLAYTALLVAIPAMLTTFVIWFLGIFYGLFAVNIILGFATGLDLGGGYLRIHHLGWASKRDLSKLTGISHCPEVNGAFPVGMYIGWLFSAPFYASSIGIFRGYQTCVEKCVLLEFGRKKIVVSPDSPEEFIAAVSEELARMGKSSVTDSSCIPSPSGKANMEFAARIKQERGKRSWTQEKMAEVSGLSVRTVQRLECGAEPSAETLRTLADTFGTTVETLSAKLRNLRFRAKYATSYIVVFGILLAVQMLSIYGMCYLLITCGPSEMFWPCISYAAIWLLVLINTFLYPASFSFKGGNLVVQHVIFATRYDLVKLTGYEIAPNAMMSALPLTFPVIVASAWYRSPVIGVFRAYITDTKNCVVLEFGRKKIVVTPENPQEFIDALREQSRGTAA
jgi:transcriptional regulator with XRE-family HTH domain